MLDAVSSLIVGGNMITIKQKGDFKNTEKFLKNKKRININILDKYGKIGVEALKKNTPVDTGVTSNSWYYEIENQNGKVTLNFYNSNVKNNINIAIIIQYGHGTKNGGWVEGIDYINPAVQPVFDKILNDVWGDLNG